MRSDDKKVERLQRSHHFIRVRVGHGDIDAGDIHGANGMWIARQDGIEDGRVMGRCLPSLWAGPERKLVGAKGSLCDLLWQREFGIMQDIDIISKSARAFHPKISAQPLDIAGNGDKAMKRAEV